MNKKDIIIFLLIALVVGGIISIFASSFPDGLEKVAEKKGFIEKAENVKPVISAPVPDYAWPGVTDERLATSLAGIFGTLLVFGIGYGIAALLKNKQHS